MARAWIAGPTPAIKGRTGRLAGSASTCALVDCPDRVGVLNDDVGDVWSRVATTPLMGRRSWSQRTPYRVAYMPSKICSNLTTFSELRRSCSVASTVLHGRSKPRYLGLPTNQTALSPAASWAWVAKVMGSVEAIRSR